MSRIPDEANAQITPIEFELLVKEYLEHLGQHLLSFSAKHDVKLKGGDGEYQIDILVEFEYLGVAFKVLVECKRHFDKIKRETVQIMNDRIRAIGAQKGLIFCTSGFQSGAIEYAAQHGIALIRVIDGRYSVFTKSLNSQNYEPPPELGIPKYVGEFRQGNSISYLDPDYIETLAEFVFGSVPE